VYCMTMLPYPQELPAISFVVFRMTFGKSRAEDTFSGLFGLVFTFSKSLSQLLTPNIRAIAKPEKYVLFNFISSIF